MTYRNLSGIYFHYKKENVCFEELPESEQDRILEEYSDERKKQLIKSLAGTIKQIGDELDIISQ